MPDSLTAILKRAEQHGILQRKVVKGGVTEYLPTEPGEPGTASKWSPDQPRDELGRFGSGGGGGRGGADLSRIPAAERGASYGQFRHVLGASGVELPRDIISPIPDFDAYGEAIPTFHHAEIVNQAELIGQYKEQGASELDKTLEEAGLKSGSWNGDAVQAAWADTSNDRGGPQDKLQAEAQRRLPSDVQTDDTTGMKIARVDMERHPGEDEAAALTYDSIQERTQEYLRSKGYEPDDEILVYRGIDGPFGEQLSSKLEPGDSAEVVRSRPLSSWSLDPMTARSFSSQAGVVVASKVRAGDIFSHFATGFGCMYENEVVLPAGAVKEAKVIYAGPK